MRCRSMAFAALAACLAGAAPTEPARAQACKEDGPTLVCAHGGKNYRVIQNTASPAQRYAIAWRPARSAEDSEFDSDDEERKALIDEPCENFIVRLSDGLPLRKIAGTHFGDREQYNHRQKVAMWSPDERWLVEIEDSKWSSDVAQAYRIDKDGASPGVSLLAPLRKAALAYLARQKKRIKTAEFLDSVQMKEVGNDGTLALTFIMQVPKKQSYSFAAKLAPAPNAGTVRVTITAMEYDPGDPD